MHITNLRRVGGSVMLAVPPAILDLLDMRAGTSVGVTVHDGRLVIEPNPRPHYTMDELLGQCDATAEVAAEDHQWLAAKPVGRELL